MQYTCAYFTDWNNTVDQAQHDKMEMICRQTASDSPVIVCWIFGCGWGGLLCYAAENYGVQAHGITLSEAQIEFAQNWAKQRGLSDKVYIRDPRLRRSRRHL